MVSRQKASRINGNHRNNLAYRIYQGAATLSFGPMDRVSCLGPLGGVSRVGDDPKTFISIHCHRH